MPQAMRGKHRNGAGAETVKVNSWRERAKATSRLAETKSLKQTFSALGARQHGGAECRVLLMVHSTRREKVAERA